ncbi:MAG: hypothetical protein WBD18_06365, partial [Phycisphaerae bacterium]
NEGVGLAGFFLRLRNAWRTDMAILLTMTETRGAHKSSITQHSVVVKVVVAKKWPYGCGRKSLN